MGVMLALASLAALDEARQQRVAAMSALVPTTSSDPREAFVRPFASREDRRAAGRAFLIRNQRRRR